MQTGQTTGTDGKGRSVTQNSTPSLPPKSGKASMSSAASTTVGRGVTQSNYGMRPLSTTTGANPKMNAELSQKFDGLMADHTKLSKQSPGKEKWLSFLGNVVKFLTFGQASLGKNLTESSQKLHGQMERIKGEVEGLQKEFNKTNLNPLQIKALEEADCRRNGRDQRGEGCFFKGIIWNPIDL